jgi:hypothetical protein
MLRIGPARPRTARGPTARSCRPAPSSSEGLFTVHRVDDKWLYEIPGDMLGREMILITRVTRTPAGMGFGGHRQTTASVRWERSGDRILLRQVSHENVAADSLPIYEAVRNSNFEPVLHAFPIRAMSPDGRRGGDRRLRILRLRCPHHRAEPAATAAVRRPPPGQRPDLHRVDACLPGEPRGAARGELRGEQPALEPGERHPLHGARPLADGPPGEPDDAAALG